MKTTSLEYRHFYCSLMPPRKKGSLALVFFKGLWEMACEELNQLKANLNIFAVIFPGSYRFITRGTWLLDFDSHCVKQPSSHPNNSLPWGWQQVAHPPEFRQQEQGTTTWEFPVGLPLSEEVPCAAFPASRCWPRVTLPTASSATAPALFPLPAPANVCPPRPPRGNKPCLHSNTRFWTGQTGTQASVLGERCLPDLSG